MTLTQYTSAARGRVDQARGVLAEHVRDKLGQCVVCHELGCKPRADALAVVRESERPDPVPHRDRRPRARLIRLRRSG
jgi:hypothetical protein